MVFPKNLPLPRLWPLRGQGKECHRWAADRHASEQWGSRGM